MLAFVQGGHFECLGALTTAAATSPGAISAETLIYYLAAIACLVGLLLLSVTSNWNPTSPPKKTAKDVVKELGVALLVASITALIVDVNLSEHGKEVLAEVKDQVLRKELETKVGVKVADEVIEQIVSRKIQYSNYQVDLELSKERDEQHQSPPFVSCETTLEFTVENIGEEDTPWKFQNTLSGIRRDRTVKYHKITIVERDVNMADPPATHLANWSEDADKDLVDFAQVFKQQLSDSGARLVISKDLVLKPNHEYRVFVHKTVTDDMMSTYNVRPAFSTVGLTLNVSYNPKEVLIRDYGFMYPAWRGKTQAENSQGVLRVQIDSTVLPQQGLYVDWGPQAAN